MFNCPRQEQYNKEHRTYKAWIYLANRFKNKSHQEMDSKGNHFRRLGLHTQVDHGTNRI